MSTQSATEPASAQEPASAPMRRLFTGRLISLLDLLRRSGALANRRAFDLSSIEWRIMSQVGEHAPLSLNDLAELLSIDRGQLSRNVKAMVGRGLLNSRRRPGGPAIVITLSDEGRALHGRMVELATERNRFLVGDLPDEEVERLARSLETITRKAQLLLEREQTLAAASRAAGEEE